MRSCCRQRPLQHSNSARRAIRSRCMRKTFSPCRSTLRGCRRSRCRWVPSNAKENSCPSDSRSSHRTGAKRLFLRLGRTSNEIDMALPARDEAQKILEQHVKDAYQRTHAKMVGIAMSGYAAKYGEDADLWYITGLLHDV